MLPFNRKVIEINETLGGLDEGYSITILTCSSHFQRRYRPFCSMSPRLSAPNRDPAEVYKKERREMRRGSDTELLKVRATSNECKKDLAQEELRHREHARNVQTDRRIAKWTVVVSIAALVVSIIAIVASVH
jgi:hypothetical protein